MKIRDKIEQRIDNGDYPYYRTKRGKLLWVKNAYDTYSSITRSKILVDAFGRFWGYSDDHRIIAIQENFFK